MTRCLRELLRFLRRFPAQSLLPFRSPTRKMARPEPQARPVRKVLLGLRVRRVHRAFRALPVTRAQPAPLALKATLLLGLRVQREMRLRFPVQPVPQDQLERRVHKAILARPAHKESKAFRAIKARLAPLGLLVLSVLLELPDRPARKAFKARPALLAHKDRRVFKACREKLGLQVQPERKGHRVMSARLVLKAHKAILVLPALLDRLEQLAQLDLLAPQEAPELLVQLDLLAPRAFKAMSVLPGHKVCRAFRVFKV